MRLLAIAQATRVEANIRVSFACYECPEYLRSRLVQEGFGFVALASSYNTSDIAALKADVLFIDDYKVQDTQWQMFARSGALLVNIDDDTHSKPLYGDLIINASANAQHSAYALRAPKAMLCLGPEFTLLRQEFSEQVVIPLANRQQVLITLGGADVKNMTYPLALSLLQKLPNKVAVCALIGGLQNSSTQKLHDLTRQYSNLQVIQQSDCVAKLMMSSGLAISAAGGTLGELASMGTPAIALVSVDNQKAALTTPPPYRWYQAVDVREFHASAPEQWHVSSNAALVDRITTTAEHLFTDMTKRQHMSEQATQLVDGKGCNRIVQKILSMPSLATLL